MSKFDPAIHHRRSIRLKGYDYSQAGLYFITVCVQNRECVFGNVENGKMILNDAGQIAHNEWLKTAELRKNVQLHNFIVMPNHFHTIFEITHKIADVDIRGNVPVGAYCIRPDGARDNGDMRDNDYSNKSDVGNYQNDENNPVYEEGVCNTPLRSPAQTVGAIMRGYKSAVTRQINALGVPFKWQRDMYEHIIRDYGDYVRIDEYIFANPEKWENDIFYNK